MQMKVTYLGHGGNYREGDNCDTEIVDVETTAQAVRAWNAAHFATPGENRAERYRVEPVVSSVVVEVGPPPTGDEVVYIDAENI